MAGASPGASARDDAVQRACFAPEALAAITNENVPVKGDRRFDNPKKLAEAPALAPVPPELRGSIRRVELPPGEKLIALTFDLCEDRGEVSGYEGRIFDYLRKEGIKATLFAGGKWMRSHRARAEQLITDPLFEIANHSDTHHNTRLIEAAKLNEEIHNPLRTYRILREELSATQCAARAAGAFTSVPQQMAMYRFPFGACNPATMKAVNDAGLLAIQWDVSTGDPDPHVSADAIVNAMVRETKPGSIIIAHANGRGWHTADALPIAIPKLKAKGYTFVTVSELLARGKPVIADSCFDRHPGDSDRYDFLGALRHKLHEKTVAGSGERLPWSVRKLEPAKAP